MIKKPLNIIIIGLIVIVFILLGINYFPKDTNAESTAQTIERFKENGRTVYVYAKRKNIRSKKKLPFT